MESSVSSSPFSPGVRSLETPAQELSPLHFLAHGAVRDLHEKLQVHERRLGTPAEQPGDLERARALAHEINNLALREYLLAILTLPTGRASLLDAALDGRLVA